jgi:hypothetical protein
MRALLDANLWDGMLFEDMFDMQATMFQPVGGMDRIAAAFEKKLSNSIRFGATVERMARRRGSIGPSRRVTNRPDEGDTDSKKYLVDFRVRDNPFACRPSKAERAPQMIQGARCSGSAKTRTQLSPRIQD